MEDHKPRLIKAFLVSAIVGSVVPLLILGFTYYEYNYGAPIDASEAQGGFIIAVHCLVALVFCLVFFPLAGFMLNSKNSLSRSSFRLVTYISLAITSVITATILTFVGFGAAALLISLLSFGILGLMCLPVGALWLRAAQVT